MARGTIEVTVTGIEIIRCKDCKWFEEIADGDMNLFYECRLHSIYPKEDDFCSWAESR